MCGCPASPFDIYVVLVGVVILKPDYGRTFTDVVGFVVHQRDYVRTCMCCCFCFPPGRLQLIMLCVWLISWSSSQTTAELGLL